MHSCISADSSVTAPCRLSPLPLVVQVIRVMSANAAIVAIRTFGTILIARQQGASIASNTARAIQTWQLQERDRGSAADDVLSISNCKGKTQANKMHNIGLPAQKTPDTLQDSTAQHVPA